MKKILRKASLAFKSSLIAGLLLITYGVSAMPTIEPFVFELYNNGTKPIYYGLSDTWGTYSNVLCTTVNGLTMKEQVRGLIEPGEIKDFSIALVENYITNCWGTEFWATFTYGISADGANYGMNFSSLRIQFLSTYNKNKTSPFKWVSTISSGATAAPQTATTFVVNEETGIQQLMIYSDSTDFIY